MIWLQYFMFFIAFQGLLISIILLYITPSNKKIINLLFALLLLSISLYILPNSIARFPVDYPRLYLISNIFIYTYTPIFYFLIKVLFDDTYTFQKKHYAYFTPILIYAIFLIRYMLMSDALLLKLLQLGDLTDLYIIDVLTFGFNLYIIYSIWNLLKVNKSQLGKHQKRAIIVFTAFILLNNILWINGVLQHLDVWFSINLAYHAAHWISISFFIFFLFSFLIIRSNFFKEYVLTKSPENFQMDHLQADEIGSILRNLMKNKKPYLDAEFSLSDLSNLSGIKKYQLSRFINKFMKTTFFELINSYRLDEFLTLCDSKEYKNLSIIAIAYESGFKSKSTFYKVFKEKKGLSPKEYLKNINSLYYR